MLPRNLEFQRKNKIKWQFKVTKKLLKLENKDFSRVTYFINLGEIVPIKTQILDKEGNAK